MWALLYYLQQINYNARHGYGYADGLRYDGAGTYAHHFCLCNVPLCENFHHGYYRHDFLLLILQPRDSIRGEPKIKIFS